MNASFIRCFSSLLSSFAINCVVPAKAGDAYRAYVIAAAVQGGFFSILGIIIAERIYDLICVLALFAGGLAGILALEPGIGGGITAQALNVLAFISVILAVVFAAIRFLDKLAAFFVPKKFIGAFHEIKSGYFAGFRHPFPSALLTFFVWLFELSAFAIILYSGGLNPGFFQTLFTSTAATLSNAVPFTPGGLGAFELAAREILIAFGFKASLAIAAITLIRLIGYWGLMAVGALFLLPESVGRTKKRT